MVKLFITIIILLLYNIAMGKDMDSSLQESVRFHLVKHNPTDQEDYYIISLEYLNDRGRLFLDSLINTNRSQFDFYGKEFISLQCSNKTVSPTIYHFEDNLGGILPYFKFLIGFKKTKNCIEKKIVIKLNSLEFQIPTYKKINN